MIDLRSLNMAEMEAFVQDVLGEKKFRAKQIYGWLNKNLVCSFDEMTNLPKTMIEKLAALAFISTVKIKEKLISNEDETIKYLFELENDTIIESVLMKYSFGNSVCCSTQAGCCMGCKFCASTIDGVERNLTAGEICGQVYAIQKDIGERVSNIVLMGSGEPFDNFENVMKFIEIINSKAGLDIGQRHITISTCGLIEPILDFTERKLQVNLAISLHAPNDEIRRTLMPVANSYKMDDILKTCKAYSQQTGRRVTYEYALIDGVNDSKKCAQELGRKLQHSLCHVNLIPVNTVAERNFMESGKEAISIFAETLKNLGVETTVRRKLGGDINGACGQLRRMYRGERYESDRKNRHRAGTEQ